MHVGNSAVYAMTQMYREQHNYIGEYTINIRHLISPNKLNLTALQDT